jgi:cyclopropane fatty-acyl-phospholipid synthase-like methyltransferase
MNGKENTAKKRYTGPVKTYKFKLYKSTHNDRLHWMINAAGLSYNHCLSLYKRYYRLYHKTLNKFNLQKHMTKEKKWHKTVDGTRCLRYPYDILAISFHFQEKEIVYPFK